MSTPNPGGGKRAPAVLRKARRPRTISTSGDAVVDQSLAEKAYGLILDRILRGTLPFGAPIARRELSAELGMSLLPVSAALQRLEHESLIESVPRVGTRVCVPSPQDIRGFWVVREALESQAARLFAQRAGEKDRQAIVEMAARLDRAYMECAEAAEVSDEDLYQLRELHARFHLQIAEWALCPQLLRALEKNQVLTFNWFYDRFFGRASLPPNWHTELARALAAGDPADADAAMRRHVQYKLDRLILLLEPYLSITRMDLLTAK